MPKVERWVPAEDAPAPSAGRNSRGGAPRFGASVEIVDINEKRLAVTGQNWFLPWRERREGFLPGCWRLVPESGNRDDPTAVGVWLDDRQIGYLYRDDAERYTRALEIVRANLVVQIHDVQTDSHALTMRAPAPRALLKLARGR